MPRRLRVVHLFDDATSGGVMRVLDHIRTSPDMTRQADHVCIQIRRGAISGRAYTADVVVSHLALSWRSMPALIALRLANRNATLIHVEHSYTQAFVRHNVPNQRRFFALLKAAFALFDRVIAVSHGQAEWLSRAALCAPDKLAVVRSCVDVSDFEALSAPSDRPRVFAAIGRLDRQKGFDTLISAFRDVNNPDIALHIHGKGEEEARLRALAQGDARIVFHGFTPEPWRAVAAADAIVVPSLWEAYGLVAIEAIAARRPVFCADVDGLADHAAYGAHLLQVSSEGHCRDALSALFRMPPEQVSPGTGAATDLQRDFVSGWARVLGLAPSPA